jgi:hypothetical protein
MDKLNGGEAASAVTGEDPAMSDDQEHPREKPGAGAGRHEPDETREFSPFADEPGVGGPGVGGPGAGGPGAGNLDETRADEPFAGLAGPDGGTRSGVTDSADGPSWVSDHTEQMPATPGTGPSEQDGTRVIPAVDDATQVTPPADAATSTLPRGDWADPGRAEAAARAAAGRTEPDWETRSEPVWAARAQVRTPRPGAGGDYTTHTDWAPVPSEPRRVWWSPILIGILVMLLIAALGFGVWLIVQSVGDDEPTAPVVTGSVVPSPAPVTTEPSSTPTSAAATTKPPSSAPPEPAEVSIPALVGLSSADARRALDRVGLTYRLIFRSSDAEPGTVIDSDPPEGREVPADTEVTLVIAAARSSAPTTGTPTTLEGVDEPNE